MADNCTIRNTTETIDFTSSVFITINVLLILVICGGNMLTVVAVWRTPVLRTVPNMYVVSLAAADFLAGIVLPLQIFTYIPSLDVIVVNNKYLCLIRQVALFVSGLASIFSMVSIAFDRVLYIKNPLHYERLATVCKAALVITCTWVVSMIIGTMPLYYNNWTPCRECSMFIVVTKEFQVYILGNLFIICCILTACCYGYILHVAKRHQTAIAALEIDQSRRNQTTKDMKLIKLFGLVFGIFIICWSPALLVVAIGHLDGVLPQLVNNITLPIAVMNSGMNFVVYAVKNKDFKEAFIKMLCPKKYTKERRNRSYPQ